MGVLRALRGRWWSQWFQVVQRGSNAKPKRPKSHHRLNAVTLREVWFTSLVMRGSNDNSVAFLSAGSD